MKEEFNRLIDKAIELELNVAELYIQFHRLFPSDASFWWQLAIEEKNHAALLRTLKEMNQVHLEIPTEFYPESAEALDNSSRKISIAREEFEKNPDRSLALRTAYEIENSAGEFHYDSLAKSESSSQLARIFRKLNGSDLDHARRIRKYMDGLGLS